MNDSIRQTIERCARASSEGTAHFPAIVAALAGAGVESCFADFRANVTTYYLPDGSTHAVALAPPNVAIAEGFDAAGVQQAIRGAAA